MTSTNGIPSTSGIPARWRGLVLGGGREVWDDVLAVEKLLGHPWDGIVVAANDIGMYWPRDLHHWVTLHPAKMPGWAKTRDVQHLPPGYLTWGRNARHVNRAIVPWPGGSSGLLAVQVAIHVGCTRIVLCGVPMTISPHFEESTEHHVLDSNRNWSHADKHWKSWVREAHRFRPWTRSMSGRSRHLLGPPTQEWLNDTSGMAAPVVTPG